MQACETGYTRRDGRALQACETGYKRRDGSAGGRVRPVTRGVTAAPVRGNDLPETPGQARIRVGLGTLIVWRWAGMPVAGSISIRVTSCERSFAT